MTITQKSNKYAVIIIGSILFIFVLIRAFSLSFTIDESFSYLYLAKNNLEGLIKNFNTNAHILNSIGMTLFGLIFGRSEISLRMPNVIAFLFYLIYSYKLISLVARPKYVVFYFIIFQSNIFLFDFFCLARGYGMTVSLITISLFFLIKFYQGSNKLLRTKYANNSIIFASLSVFANLTSLYYFIPLIGVFIIHNY